MKIENIFERLLAQLKKYKLSLEKKYTNEKVILRIKKEQGYLFNIYLNYIWNLKLNRLEQCTPIIIQRYIILRK